MATGDPTVYFLGHSHIDAAWLWTFTDTLDVVRDTCETVLRLMEDYPDFAYCQSSAQYYRWIEERYPATFAQIQRRVAEGRWEIVGGTWVEPDGNLPSGEAFVRQFLYGQRYFRDRFGRVVDVAWLPDSFGFAGSLPQIMRKAGIRYFVTQKLNWNDATGFPYHFFTWQAPDGSTVLAHQTVGSYHEAVDDARIRAQLTALTACHPWPHLLLLVGVGDHGGGLTREMLERAVTYVRKHHAVTGVFTTAKGYFQTLERHLDPASLPVVADELYLQYHRGTYTTVATVKQNNRRAECLLETAEKYATLAHPYQYPYPTQALQAAWELLLLNQFHDVLPGSAIPDVYAESEACFHTLFRTVADVIAASLQAIASHVETRGTGAALLVFNPLSWPRNAVIEVPVGDGKDPVIIVDDAGVSVPSQVTSDGKLVFSADALPPLGYAQYRVQPGTRGGRRRTDLSVRETAERITLANAFLRVEVATATGLVHRIYDKAAERDVLRAAGNRIQIFEDYPVRGRQTLHSNLDASRFDAWEVFIYQQPDGIQYVELQAPEAVTVVDRGPVMARVVVHYRYSQADRPDSTFRTEIRLYPNLPWVEFHLAVDWHAAHRLAKVAFPLTVQSDVTTYEIPYGSIQRRNPLSPTATLAERAKYEVPGQKWIDHTHPDGSYGVSLLNDSKYGFDVVDNTLRMTLLRSATPPTELRAHFGLPVPNGTAGQVTDQGLHHCVYALYPHAADFTAAGTPQKAYALNYPPTLHREASHPGPLPRHHAFLTVHPSTVLLTTLKKAEDSDGIIVRLHEASGHATDTILTVPEGLTHAFDTDLLETKLQVILLEHGTMRLAMKEHEVRTILLERAADTDG